MSSTPVNLLDLKPEEFKKFVDSFDHVFSDCDGVIWLGNIFPRVGEFFNLMEKHGKTINFVSNNSLRTRADFKAKFQEANIRNGLDRLIVPSVAIAEYLKAQNFNKKVYCVTCDETLNVLQSYGFQCETGPIVGPENFEDYVQYLEDDPDIGAVVSDFDFKGNLAKIHRAVTYLKRPEVLFLCGATDPVMHFSKKGYTALGCAIFTDIIAGEANRGPTVVAKPSKLFGEFAMKRAGVTDPSRVLFIGDLIEQDVGLGKNTGFKTLLLLTNTPKEEMLEHDSIRPDYYADSLASIVPLL